MTRPHYDIVGLVSNDLTFDRRMIRTCESLVKDGFKVALVGRELQSSLKLGNKVFDQYRVNCKFNSGPLFYIELVFKLNNWLQGVTFDKVIFVDFDTLLVSRIIKKKNRKLYLDLHEDFVEVPELEGRYITKFIWKAIEKFCLPRIDIIYTVNNTLGSIFSKRYLRKVDVIRNISYSNPQALPAFEMPLRTVYLGVLNPGRGLKKLIEVIRRRRDVKLSVIGDGPLLESLIHLAGDAKNIVFEGFVPPEKIASKLHGMHTGWNLLVNSSKSYYNSLANKFFDYILHGIPVMTMDFPEYRQLINEYHCGYLINELSSKDINDSIDFIIHNPEKWQEMYRACLIFSETHDWKLESQKLKTLFEN